MELTQLTYQTNESKTTNPPRAFSETLICRRGEIRRTRVSSCGSYRSTHEESAMLGESDFAALKALCGEEAFFAALESRLHPQNAQPQPFAPPAAGGCASASLTVEANGVALRFTGEQTAPFQAAITKMQALAGTMYGGGIPVGIGAIPVPPPAPPKETGGGRFCPECGTPYAKNETFCRNCGAKRGKE